MGYSECSRFPKRHTAKLLVPIFTPDRPWAHTLSHEKARERTKCYKLVKMS